LEWQTNGEQPDFPRTRAMSLKSNRNQIVSADRKICPQSHQETPAIGPKNSGCWCKRRALTTKLPTRRFRRPEQALVQSSWALAKSLGNSMLHRRFDFERDAVRVPVIALKIFGFVRNRGKHRACASSVDLRLGLVSFRTGWNLHRRENRRTQSRLEIRIRSSSADSARHARRANLRGFEVTLSGV
jgi:hypothetical protein